MDIEEVKSRIIAEVDSRRDEICELSRKIHDNPELGFHEFKASAWLIEFLEKNGFTVERGFAGLETAFRASYGRGRPWVTAAAIT